MKQPSRALVILAAGIGSRFRGGVKQLQRVGPNGECLMEYAIYDAVHAGFDQIVFIIRHEIEPMFEEMVASRVRAFCQQHNVQVDYAYQEKEDLPVGFSAQNRTKPWGTGHALLCCKTLLKVPFVVINADDYYGKQAFEILASFLGRLQDTNHGRYAIAGYRLKNTLSDFGSVTRGVCRVDEQNMLKCITETRQILKMGENGKTETNDATVIIPGDTVVSMNMWAFTPDVLEQLEIKFTSFLESACTSEQQPEFILPVVIGELLEKNIVTVQVLPTYDQWFGLTYQEDTPLVEAMLKHLAQTGVYPTPLFEKLP